MDDLLKVLRDIQKCPHLYLGEPSLERLYSYIGGFSCAEEIFGRQSTCLDGFQEYIQGIYNIHSDQNWANIIQFFCVTQAEAFDMFYKHLDDFIRQNNY